MQTRLIIIHERDPQPAKRESTNRPTTSPTAAKGRRRPNPTRGDSGRLVFVNWLPGRLIRCTGGMLAAALLLAGGTTGRAEATAAAFDAANAAYSQGRYAEAARGFESVLAQKGFSAPVLYNLANAQMRDGRFGAAILNYERARILAPNDPEIATNLRLARTRTAGAAGVAAVDSSFMRRLPFNTWCGVAAAALGIACAAVVLQRVGRRGRAGLGFGGLVAAMVFLTALTVIALRWRDLDRAIVVARECPLRISPTTVGEQLFPLHEGDAVTVRRTRGEYAFVDARNGKAGWVRRIDIGRVYVAAPR